VLDLNRFRATIRHLPRPGELMTAKERLNTGLETARTLIAMGDTPGAQALLNRLGSDPEIASVVPQTTLGLPRRLHSAFLHLAKAKGDALAKAGYQFHLVPRPEVLAPLARFTLAEQRRINDANRRPVPRVIHQIWIGTLPVPEAVAAWKSHAAAQSYDYRLWREGDLAGLGLAGNPVFADMLARGDYPGAVDVARYAILAAEGGIYLDCDWYPARDDIGFHDLLPLSGLTALAEETPRLTGMGGLLLANSFIATPKDHPALHRLNDALPGSLAALPGAPAWWSTGPLIFTLIARGGAVSLAAPTLVAGSLQRRAAIVEVEALRKKAEKDDGGLLIAWKSW
jgi:inositol phosphorylceramide mannosyltransferase catalytic subunit